MEQIEGVDPTNIKEQFTTKNVDYFFVEREKGEPQYVQLLDLDSIASKSVSKKESFKVGLKHGSVKLSRSQSVPRKPIPAINLSDAAANIPKIFTFNGFFSNISQATKQEDSVSSSNGSMHNRMDQMVNGLCNSSITSARSDQ